MMYLGDKAVGINNEKYSYPLRYVNTARMLYQNQSLPDIFVADFTGNSNIQSFENAFNGVECNDSIIIRGLQPAISGFNFAGVFWSCTANKIIFDNCVVAPSSFNYAFRQMKNLTKIIGELDFTNAITAGSMFYETSNITSIRFKTNSLSISIGNSTYLSKLDDDSIISICNGFNPNSSIKEFQFNKIIAPRLTAINGNNDNGLFVADESGTMSLQDFITNIKGWTITTN